MIDYPWQPGAPLNGGQRTLEGTKGHICLGLALLVQISQAVLFHHIPGEVVMLVVFV